MLKCEEATKLASDGMDRRLSLAESLGLKLHLIGCGACTNFNRQIRLIGSVSRRFARQSSAATED
ncbi:zf-HC2 domain-containing protein [Rhizobium sp. AAP43]|uniref:zf-HC2 domain-containing protein n=1 Tax=Rhizobium sp. AAP43 TaxID=1523420 RepID=UPI0006B940D8|nr:zf-HC2 domain-containing protein [Rhizobium sp. AAP43]KPF46124.1 hypothetical protein IP76_04180 [Rhizobium sp. AAP43]